MTLLFNTTTVWLEIPDEIATAARQRSQAIAIPGNRWQAYLNQVSLHSMMSWLQERFGQTVSADEPSAPDVWALVNGSRLTVGPWQIVIIPVEEMDQSEFRVPQEWVDLPSWVGDYYLAVAVDPDERCLQVWGYATHQQLKTHGRYDGSDRTYSLASGDLIPDLSALWVMSHLAPEVTRADLPCLPQLTREQAEGLVQQLGNGAIALPRLEVPFLQWGALLAEPDWLQRLSQRRQSQPTRQVPENLSQISTSSPVQLSRWLQNVIDAGWRSIEEWLDAEPELAFSFRANAVSDGGIRRAKLLRVGPDEITVLLLVLLQPEPDGRIAVQARLLPTNTPLLPAELALALLSATGEVLQSVQARSEDNSIQLKRFKCPVGMPFQLRLSLGDRHTVEDFVG
ncbi:MAG: DUF1822 family protein [Synechococcales bacterium]|nr:DUF1822 family protein [Synechococcales bacterium]